MGTPGPGGADTSMQPSRTVLVGSVVTCSLARCPGRLFTLTEFAETVDSCEPSAEVGHIHPWVALLCPPGPTPSRLTKPRSQGCGTGEWCSLGACPLCSLPTAQARQVRMEDREPASLLTEHCGLTWRRAQPQAGVPDQASLTQRHSALRCEDAEKIKVLPEGDAIRRRVPGPGAPGASALPASGAAGHRKSGQTRSSRT